MRRLLQQVARRWRPAAPSPVSKSEGYGGRNDGTLGRIDILVNNAGILRDKTFAKKTLEDFRLVVDVHLMSSVYCTKAV